MPAIDIQRIRTAGGRDDLQVATVDEIASTNRALMDAVFGASPAQPKLLAAAAQTAGRGRRGRGWVMEPGRSAAFSIAIERRTGRGVAAIGLPIAVGVATRRALALLAPAPDLRLKWPNDLQRNGRKLGGILVESRRGPGGTQSIERFVIGIGLNLFAPRDADARIGQPACGLFDDRGTPPVALETVIGRVAGEVVESVLLFLDEGLAPFRQAWHQHDVLRDEPVSILENGFVVCAGIARGIGADGALLVETGSGLREIASGEVSVRSLPAARVRQAG